MNNNKSHMKPVNVSVTKYVSVSLCTIYMIQYYKTSPFFTVYALKYIIQVCKECQISESQELRRKTDRMYPQHLTRGHKPNKTADATTD